MMGSIELSGRTILVVEDEMLLAMMLESILEDAGCRVLCVASVAKGLAMATETDIDAAVLDVNLNGVRSYALADRLVERCVPFIFATGYGDAELRTLYPGRPIVPKPYLDHDVLAALNHVIQN